MTLAPTRERMPRLPRAWYWLADSRSLARGPVARSLLGRRVVAFRTAAGRFAALDARCSHLGADLGRGKVLGESIQCPFHHWCYDVDGHCRHVPRQSTVPPF